VLISVQDSGTGINPEQLIVCSTHSSRPNQTALAWVYLSVVR
jgi:hypothetical protein